MNPVADALRRHAELVSNAQLVRAQGKLARLDPDERGAVHELARCVAGGVAESLLEEARSDGRLASALESVYGPGG